MKVSVGRVFLRPGGEKEEGPRDKKQQLDLGKKQCSRRGSGYDTKKKKKKQLDR